MPGAPDQDAWELYGSALLCGIALLLLLPHVLSWHLRKVLSKCLCCKRENRAPTRLLALDFQSTANIYGLLTGLCVALVLRIIWLVLNGLNVLGNTSQCLSGLECIPQVFVTLTNRIAQLMYFVICSRVMKYLGFAAHARAFGYRHWLVPPSVALATRSGSTTPRSTRSTGSAFALTDAKSTTAAMGAFQTELRDKLQTLPVMGWDLSHIALDWWMVVLQLSTLIVTVFTDMPHDSAYPVYEAYQLQVGAMYLLLGYLYGIIAYQYRALIMTGVRLFLTHISCGCWCFSIATSTDLNEEEVNALYAAYEHNGEGLDPEVRKSLRLNHPYKFGGPTSASGLVKGNGLAITTATTTYSTYTPGGGGGGSQDQSRPLLQNGSIFVSDAAREPVVSTSALTGRTLQVVPSAVAPVQGPLSTGSKTGPRRAKSSLNTPSPAASSSTPSIAYQQSVPEHGVLQYSHSAAPQGSTVPGASLLPLAPVPVGAYVPVPPPAAPGIGERRTSHLNIVSVVAVRTPGSGAPSPSKGAFEVHPSPSPPAETHGTSNSNGYGNGNGGSGTTSSTSTVRTPLLAAGAPLPLQQSSAILQQQRQQAVATHTGNIPDAMAVSAPIARITVQFDNDAYTMFALCCLLIAALYVLRTALFLYTPITNGGRIHGLASSVLYPWMFYSVPEAIPSLIILHLLLPGGLLSVLPLPKTCPRRRPTPTR